MCLTWGHTSFTWEALGEDLRMALLAVLESLPSIEEHSIMEFLRTLSADDKKAVISL